MKKISLMALSFSLCACVACAKDFISIGTGSMTGTYYPVGGAICKIVNMDKSMSCSVQSTGGSVYNVNSVLAKELNFGFVQSDVTYDKYNGKGNFDGQGDQNLRSVIAIYPELLAFVVSKQSGIKTYTDVAGKSINIGNPGSGNEVTSTIIFKKYGVDLKELGYHGVLTAQECPTALKDKKIDGYFYMVGHPTANITDASNSIDIDLVGIDDAKIDEILKEYPYFAKGVIQKDLYKGVEHDTQTIGVKAVLVTTKDQSDASVKAIVKGILDNFDEYKKLHPALNSVTKGSLIKGLGAPLHPAAEAAFKEAGILKD